MEQSGFLNSDFLHGASSVRVEGLTGNLDNFNQSNDIPAGSSWVVLPVSEDEDEKGGICNLVKKKYAAAGTLGVCKRQGYCRDEV